MKSFKKGIATVGVYLDGNLVRKIFKSKNKYEKEKQFYLTWHHKVQFIPKLRRFCDVTKSIWTEYCGESLNIKYKPEDRQKFKPAIRYLVSLLFEQTYHYHNDVRWKNVVESDCGELFLIDFEVVSTENRERDPEWILRDKPKKTK